MTKKYFFFLDTDFFPSKEDKVHVIYRADLYVVV